MKRQIKYCRYIPDFHGSPAWMPVAEAEWRLQKDNEYIEKMISLLGDDPAQKEYWSSKHPRIEYVK